MENILDRLDDIEQAVQKLGNANKPDLPAEPDNARKPYLVSEDKNKTVRFSEMSSLLMGSGKTGAKTYSKYIN